MWTGKKEQSFVSVFLNFVFYFHLKMFLSKIELVGFKSFANKTTLDFNSKITAIVGPNGCGKTNIVDAIRWVLGEQKTSLLRSEVMESVIFNGSATRKPLGAAEVSITFLNDKGILPTQFSELTVTRKLYRDGKSEYYINNTQCRLKDISDLFADTGIGNNSYSIIELKMIETLLNGSIEERRRLLEETAGITKYKHRKKETTKRLDSVQNDLLRIYDLLNEIEHQVRALSRQAAKTRRYNKIQQELKSLELDYWLFLFNKSNGIVTSLEEENKLLSNDILQLEDELNSVNDEIENLQSKILELESEIETVRTRENILFREYSNVQNQINLEQEKINSLHQAEKKIISDTDETNKMLNRFSQTFNELRKLQETKKKELETKEKEFKEIESRYKDKEQVIREKRNFVQTLKESFITLEKELKFERLNLEKLKVAKSQTEEKKRKSLEHIQELSNKISAQEEKIHRIKNDLEIKTRSLSTLISKKQELESFESIKTEQIQNLKKKHTEYQIALKEINTSLDFLKSILEVDESTKFLIKDSNWQLNRKFALLGEILSIDEQYRVAYDSLLGQFKNVVLVENEAEIIAAKELLSKEHKGKCLFVSLESIPDIDFKVDFLEHPKIIGYASELPNVDSNIRTILRLILGNSVIVKDFSDAVEIASKFRVQSVVTLAGELIYGGTIQKRGSIVHKEGLSIGKIERIKKLEEKKATLTRGLDELNSEINNIEEELSELRKQIENNHNEQKALENSVNQIEVALSKEELLLEQLKNEKLSKEEIIKSNEVESINYDNEINKLITSIAEKESQINAISGDLAEAEKELNGILEDFEQEQLRVREIEKQVVQLRTELMSIEKEIQRIEHSKRNFESKILKLSEEVAKLKSESEHRKNNIDILVKSKLEFESELQKIKNEKGLLQSQKKEMEDILLQQEEYKEQIQSTMNKKLTKLHQNEVEIARQKEISHSLFSKALENYEVNLNDYVLSSSITDEDVSQIEFKISELKKSLSSLGNVNFLALQEYEEQKERLELYKTQIEDLVNSEKSLKEALKEINETAEKKFLETYEKVNENFNKVFKELFGGDSHAELVIDVDNPLDSDVEIRVKPSGKRINSIETLSQGEKTLTVLSLLFALYLVKPSPFCVFDEVDAPLDDANVDRFLNLLKKFSADTQFIIITHNKRTMEFANFLYGITMAEDGISKVLSVKLVE